MWIVPLLCYILSLFGTMIGIQYHINLFKYRYYFAVPVILAVFIPISIIILLPIDYIKHNFEIISWFNLSDKVILILWRTKYWISFVLTWAILPTLQEYYRSGHYNKILKLKDSFRQNLKFQLIMLAISLACAFYLTFEVGLSFHNLKLMIIGLTHIYSLTLALWLMAHGLIAIPRQRWIEGSVILNLNYLYLKIPKLIDNLEDHKISFKEDVLKVIVLTKNFTNDPDDFEFRDWILQLNRQIPSDLAEMMDQQYLDNFSHETITREQLNTSFLVKLTKDFQNNLNKLIAYESEYESIFNKIIKLEDILSGHVNNNQLNFRLPMHNYIFTEKFTVIYYYYIRPIMSRIFSVLLFTISFMILESEFFHSTKMSIINILINKFENHNFIQLLLTVLLFSYMLFSSLTSLTSLKIFNIYHLVRQNSDPVSTSWYAMYIARLTIPLSYNFITLFISRKSIFEDWFGSSIHLTGLFNLLNNWLPRFVLVPVILTTFHIYDILKKRLGFTDFYSNWGFSEDEDEEENGDHTPSKRRDLIIVEAKRIINREINKRTNQTNYRTFNLSNAANMNYENNRREFHNALTSNYRDETRIDLESNIDDSLNMLHNQPTMWDRINGTFINLKESVAGRFTRQEYRDDPLDFNYDDDADQNIII
jgi:hypothetical protein